MKKLLAMGIILGVAACGGGDEGELDELDTDVELEQPAPATMPSDTMTMDTMMMEDTMSMDTMDAGTP